MTIRGTNQQRHDIPRSGETWIWREVGYLHKGVFPHNQYDWPLPTPPFRIEQTTTVVHTQFTGKDTLPFRNQYPPPIGPAPIEQTVTWSQTRMFGQDNLPKNQSDWPNPNPGSDPASRRTYEWRQVGQLGQGRPSRQLDWPNPQPVTWYRSVEVSGPSLITIVRNPFFQTDWPLPTPVTWYQSWVWNQTPFTGKDTLPNRQQDWPNPVPPFRLDQTWTNILGPGALLPPFRQSDWPNPYPVQWYKSWEAWYNLNLIGQDQLPNRQQDWPNYRPVTWYQDWSQRAQLVPVVTPIPFLQFDWPNPQPVQWYRDWSSRYTLFGQDTLPFNQKDWPNPVPPFRLDETYTKSLGPSQLLPPFRQTDWPLPGPVTWYKDWEYWYLLSLIGQDKLPNRQQDWPVPPPVTWYQDFKLDLLQSTLFTPPGVPPFINLDWPTPTPVTWYKSIEGSAFIPNIPIPPPPAQPTGGGIYPAEFYRRAMELDKEMKLHASAVELGRMGGKARLDTMSSRQRSEFARNAAEVRWRNR